LLIISSAYDSIKEIAILSRESEKCGLADDKRGLGSAFGETWIMAEGEI
jgi:hypothetical protein